MYKFEQLRKDIKGGQVLLPGNQGYQESLQRWSAACVKNAAAVVKPENAQEVSVAVKFAVKHSILLSVCGGGHSSSGTSSSEGMVIDLSNMRSVHVDADNMTVEFDGGCLWEDVDKALESYGLATVGGVVNHTGVGGLTLGGGHGWLTPLHGLTVDNLISAQVVLADGSIIEAAEDKDADLFWAIRGAGAQFGVVTRFAARAHKQGLVWSGTLAYTDDKLPEIVAVANDYYERYQCGEGHCMAIGIGYGPDGQTHGISAIPCFHGPEREARKYFSKLLAIEAVAENTRMMSTAQMNTLLNPIFEHGIRRLMGSSNITMPLSLTPLLETASRLCNFCDAHPGMGTSVLAIEFFPTDRIRAVPLEATAYANRGEYFDAMTAFGWSDESLDGEIRAFNRGLCEQIRRTNGFTGEGDGPVGRYVNVEAERVEPREAYGVNLGRLRVLKERYDPRNVFSKWHGIVG